MTDGIFTAWLRVPPSRRWQAVATGVEADVRRRLDAEAGRHRQSDTCVLPLGSDPNRRAEAPA